MKFLPAELIKNKRNGREHSADEIRFLIDGYVRGEIPDYQMAAWLMAVYFKGMTPAETATLTETMLRSGRVLDFSHLPTIAVDKHSTGGVGDKTSLILAPIAVAAGAKVPMIAGRGLGHTGGTLDKLEAIPGFRIDLGLERFNRQVETLGCAIIGQTEEICPADKRIYALRDVTGTIDSLPLICASIMSKKLAEGIGALVLDVKYGNGAFMKSLAMAETLADKLFEIGVAHGKRMAYMITSMEQPLGRFVGNALETGECIAILKGESYGGRSDFEDCRELSLELAAHMIWLSGVARDAKEGRARAERALASGEAWSVFERMCREQGGDPSQLPSARTRVDVLAARDGFVSAFDTEAIGLASITLGGGRLKASDKIDPTAGIEIHRKIGESVARGERLYTLFANLAEGDSAFAQAENMVQSATTISLQKPQAPALIARKRVP